MLEPPTRPDARRGSLRSALPSGLWLGAALAVGLLGIAIVLRVQDRSGSVPATSTFAAAAITMSVVAIVTVAGAARSIGAPWRAAITLAGGFAAITLAKFGMGPLALYRGNEVHVIQNLGGGGSGDLIVVIAIGVGLFYVAAIWLLAVVFRPAPPPDGPSVKALVTLVVVALAAVIVTGFVTSAAPDYIAFATTGVQASGIAVALFVAAGLVSAAFRDTAARSKALGQATMYLTIAWVAIAPARVPDPLGRVPLGDRGDLAAEDGDAEVIRRTALLLGRMTRPRVVVTMWTFMLLGLARHAGPALGIDLLAATVALTASYALATSLNDVADLEIDRANGLMDPSRPLSLGIATVPDMRRVAGVAGVVALAAAMPLGPMGLVVVALSLAIDYIYSAGPMQLSRRWALAPVALTIAYVALPYWLGIVVAHDRWRSTDVALVGGLCVLFFARIILKDVRDRLGDAAFGKRTLLLRLGKDATCALSVTGAAIGSAIIVLAIAPPLAVATALALDAAAIAWMLLRLRHVGDTTAELVTIGTAARAGNLLLISVLAWLLLSRQGGDPAQASMLIATLTAVGGASFLGLALQPERARIAYKAPASAQ